MPPPRDALLLAASLAVLGRLAFSRLSQLSANIVIAIFVGKLPTKPMH
jgi:hypothetical protein